MRQIDKEARARNATVAVRRYRVERRGLEACSRCGGTATPVEDQTLACDCAALEAAFQQKLESHIAPGHRPEMDDDEPSEEQWWQK